MRNRLSGRYSFKAVCRFAWPTIVMMVFMSMYTMVDGAFVSRLIGTDALSAVNLTMPALYFCYGLGIMFATGSSAIVARKMGEGLGREAKENFTFMLAVVVASGATFSLTGLWNLDGIVRLLGAGPELAAYCREYLGTLLFFMPLAMLQMMFQTYFITAGRPGFGLAAATLGGLTNIALDYVFMAKLGMGIGGAALATGIGYSIPAASGLVYFALNRKGSLSLVRPKFDWHVLLHSCGNGSSEMVTNLSLSVVTFLFNLFMMRYAGVDGVAAITIVLYAEYLFTSIYFGFSSGVAPLFSYKYGRNDEVELKKLFRNSLAFIGLCSAVAITVSIGFAGAIVSVFTSPDSAVYGYAVTGFRLHARCFLFMGFNIFASALFTALSNGKVSALLSFLRTFVFLVASLLLLPRFLGVTGVWLAVPLAETLAIVFSVGSLARLRAVYQYA